jgi:hypothetical protein
MFKVNDNIQSNLSMWSPLLSSHMYQKVTSIKQSPVLKGQKVRIEEENGKIN